MSYADWSNKKKKKYNSYEEWSNAKHGITEEEKDSALSWRNDELAPVKEEEKERTWFTSGAFDDGYQFGDITRTIIDSTNDLLQNGLEGVIGMAEPVIDTGAYVVGGVGGIFSEDFKSGTEKFIKDDLIDEEAVAKFLVSGTTETSRSMIRQAVLNDVEKFGGAEKANAILESLEKDNSIFGEKSDSLVNSAGQLAGQMYLQSQFGVPWQLTTGITSFGSGVEGALNDGATFDEAGWQGAIQAGADILTESLFKGSGLGEKGLIDLGGFTKGISNKVVKALFDYGIDITAEGMEEVAAKIFTDLGSALYKEEDLKDIMWNENSFDEYLESFIGGAFLSGVSNVKTVGGSIKNKTDYRTGFTASDEKVLDKVYNDAVKDMEAEKGESLTTREKNKLKENLMEKMYKGEIGIDTIEETLGGDTYKAYKDSLEQDEAKKKELDDLKAEYDTLYQMKNMEKSDAQIDRQKELKGIIDGFNLESNTESLKTQMSTEVEKLAKSGVLVESYNERARKSEAFTADLSKYKGKQRAAVERAIKSGVLNNTNRSHELVDILSKIEADKGISFDYTNNAKLQEAGFAVVGKTVNGFVKDGAVTLNVQSAKAWQSTVGHEIGHVLEGTDAYSALRDSLFKYAESKGELESRRASLTETYKNIDADIDAELTADLLGDYLFNDKNFIKDLTTDKNLFQKVYDEIKYLCKIATGKELTEIEKVRREFDNAWKELGKKDVETDGKTKLSISETTDGKLVAVVDNDILKNIDTTFWDNTKKETAKEAAVTALKQFSDGIVVDGITRKVNRTSRREYTRSEYTEKLYKNAPDLFADKMRAADIADDIVVATTNWNRDGGLKHPRNDNFVDFDHGTTLIMSGNNKYTAEVIVGITKNGDAVLYDVINMTPATFETKKAETSTTATTQNAIGDINEISADGIVTEKPKNVKYSISEDTKQANAVYLKAVENNDTETAQEMVYKAAAESGYTERLYHGTKQFGFTKIDGTEGHTYDEVQFFTTDSLETASTYTYASKDVRGINEKTNVDKEAETEKFSNKLASFMSSKVGKENYIDAQKILSFTKDDYFNAEEKWIKDIYKNNKKELKKKYKNFFDFQTSGECFDIEMEARSYFQQLLYLDDLKSDGIYSLVANTDNLFVIDGKGKSWAELADPRFPENREYTTREVCEWAKEQGYSGVKFENIVDSGSMADIKPANVYAFFNPREQVKSADPVTYDNNGNVIPLSERFNPKNVDIRFSLSNPVEETKDLLVLHNLSESKLLKQLELDGFPMPSLAVTNQPHTNFGSISILFDKETIDPKKNKKNKTYSADAWTPTFPQIEYETDKNVAHNFGETLRGLIDDGYYNENINSFIYDAEDSLNRNGGYEGYVDYLAEKPSVQYAFLKSKGENVDIAQKQKEIPLGFSTEERWINLYEGLIADFSGDISKLGQIPYKELVEQSPTLKNLLDKYPYKDNMRQLRMISKVLEGAKAYQNYNPNAEVEVEYIPDYAQTDRDIQARIDKTELREWLKEQTKGIVANSGVYNGKDIYTPSGNRRSFQQLHYPVTVENIVKAMAAQGEKSVTSFHGVKTLRATTAKTFKSIAEIQKAKGKLQNLTEEETNQIHDELSSQMFDVFNKIISENPGTLGKGDIFALDTIGEVMSEVEYENINASYIKGVFNKYGYDMSTETADDCFKLLDAISSMPVYIFEAKPQRVVGYDEIKAVVIPENTSIELKNALTERGISFVEYDGTEADRQTKLNEVATANDSYFSLSKQGEQFAPVGNYSTPMNELALAPTKEDIAQMETDNAPTDATPSIDEAPLPDDAMYDDAPMPNDADVPPVMENNYYAETDTTPIDDNSLKEIGAILREKLNLTASDTKAIQDIVQEYATSENPNKAELLDKITKRFGEIVTTEKNIDLSAIKKHLRETPLYIDDAVKNNITDWADFRKRLNGKIKIVQNPNDGFGLDDYYNHLVEQFPGTFNLGMDNNFGDLSNPLNQLQKIESVVNTRIFKENVDTRNTEDLQNAVDIISNAVSSYKQDLTRQTAEDTGREALDSIAPLKATQLTDGSRSDALLNQSLDNFPIKTVDDRIAENIRATEANIADLKQLRREAWNDYNSEVDELSNIYVNLKNKNTKKANDIITRVARLERLKASNDANYAKRISDLEARLEKMNTEEYNRAMHKQDKMQGYADWAANTLGDTTTWKDKKTGLQYSTNTEHRNLRDIVRDANGNKDIAKADAIYDATMGEYNRNQAAKNRKVTEVKKPFADMKITKAESTYIQMLGEFKYNPETSLTEEDVKKYYEKHKNKIDTAKVDKAIELARKTYDNAITELNAKLREQGMKEIPYRQGYFPHFTEPKQNFIQKLFNWKTQDTEIPTSIAGLTEEFKPNKSWQSFDKQRHSDETDYNFLQGLDSYLDGAYDWVYHLEDVQKRRAIENHIRYTHSEEGIKAKIKEVYADETIDADEAQARIEQILGEADNPLNNFVQDYMTHTNILTNKKNSYDRTTEQALNRKIYSTMTNVQNRVSANMVLANVRSALTNFIPITQSWAQVSPLRSLEATKDVIKNSIKDDGLVDKSTFLTNRLKEADNLHKTKWDKVLDASGIMFEVVDNFSSQVIWRSKYNDNLSKGMTESEAIKNADQFAENVMAGRSKGNEPTLFNAKSPLVKAFTMFQLEVNNQYGYFLKDVPTDLKTETNHWKLNMAKGYATAFLGAYAYNAMLEQISGSGAALDPIGIVEDLLKDLGLFDDDEEKEPSEIVTNLIENVGGELPFVGGVMFGGGRIPISSAIPYGDNGLVSGIGDFVDDVSEGNWGNVGKEMMNPLLNVAMPVGGGQLKKTVQGLKMFNTDDEHPIAGSYTDSGDLRFPVEDTTANRIQAAIFGQWANENARNYIENGRKPLNKKQTQEYIDIKMPIADYWDYREGLKGLKKNEEKANYINSLDIADWQKNLLMNNILDRKEDVDMSNYDDYADWEEFDYAQKNPEKYAVAKSVGGYSSYKTYSNDLYNIKADKDESGNSISGSRKQKVLDYINNLDANYETKLILFKMEYPSDDTYNAEIIEYINNRNDLTYEERINVFAELGFTVKDGYVYWD